MGAGPGANSPSRWQLLPAVPRLLLRPEPDGALICHANISQVSGWLPRRFGLIESSHNSLIPLLIRQVNGKGNNSSGLSFAAPNKS